MGTGNRAIEQRAVLSARVEVVRHDGDDTAAGLKGSERSGEMAVSGERVHGAGCVASDRRIHYHASRFDRYVLIDLSRVALRAAVSGTQVSYTPYPDRTHPIDKQRFGG